MPVLRSPPSPARRRPLRPAGPSRFSASVAARARARATAAALSICLDAVKAADGRIEVELIELAGLKIPGEVAAGIALEPGERDDFPALVPKLSDPPSRGSSSARPSTSATCRRSARRSSIVAIVFHKDKPLANKVGGVLAVGGGRNGGLELTVRSVQVALMSQQMIVVGRCPAYRSLGRDGLGRQPRGQQRADARHRPRRGRHRHGEEPRPPRGGDGDAAARTWMFNERGELIIATLSPRGFHEISRAKLIDPTTGQWGQRGGVCWSHPAFAYKHVFARNDRELLSQALQRNDLPDQRLAAMRKKGAPRRQFCSAAAAYPSSQLQCPHLDLVASQNLLSSDQFSRTYRRSSQVNGSVAVGRSSPAPFRRARVPSAPAVAANRPGFGLGDVFSCILNRPAARRERPAGPASRRNSKSAPGSNSWPLPQ